MIRLPKTDSFRVVRSPGGSGDPSFEIILIHGFIKNSRTSGFRAYLERGVEDATREKFRTTGRASVFAFDTADILCNGVDELERMSDKLLRKIRLLEGEGTGFRRKRRGNSEQPRFIFVAHGLGAWVVQNGLARFENLKLSFAATGVIFLDTPDRDSASFSYSRYLNDLFLEFFHERPFKRQAMSELEDRLVEVHRNWKNIGASRYVKRYEVWSIESNIDKSKKKGFGPGRFGRIMRTNSHTSEQTNRWGELDRIFDEIKSSKSERRQPSTVGVQLDDETNRPSDPANTNTNQASDIDQPEQPLALVTSHSSSIAFKSGNDPSSPNVEPRARGLLHSTPPASHRGSIVSSINDEQRVSRISTTALPLSPQDKEELKKITDLARSYLQRGNLDNAYVFYERCDIMLRKLHMEDSVQHVLVRMQMAITLLQQGKYTEATRKLESMKEVLESQRRQFLPDSDLRKQIDGDLRDLEWWLSLSLLRQGRYRESKEKLDRLVVVLTGKQKAGEMDAQTTKEQDILDLARVRRILALANGYLGNYTAAFDQILLVSSSFPTIDGGKSEKGPSEPSDPVHDALGKTVSTKLDSIELQTVNRSVHILACQYNFEYTESIIHMLWGDYREALIKANSALQGFTKQWGQKHFRSLEVASLVAILLAYNSDTGKATIVCRRTLEALTTNVGNFHPLTLQTMEVLVYIFQSQSRFTEAVDTSGSLCTRIEACLGSDHPQTLRSKSQLAAASLSCGNYRTSETILREVTQTSQQVLGDDHPDTLRFKSELAQAYCYSWRIKLAEDLLLEVIPKQRIKYTISEQKRISDQQAATDSSRKTTLSGVLKDVMDDVTTLRVHPNLLFSLQLLAKIESKKTVPDLELVQQIQQAVWDRRKDQRRLGPTHALSLASEFELATTYREKGDLQKALEEFEVVAKERSKLLGAEHPDTLAARHEALVMKYTLGQKVNVGDLEPILKLREWQLGRCHPDTHQSLLWIFAIQLLQGKDAEAYETADKLLDRLSEPAVRRERLIESLQTAEKVALFYKGQEHFGRSARVFSDILRAIEDSEATADKSLYLDTLRSCASNNLEIVKEKGLLQCDNLLQQASSEFEKDNVERADEFVRMICADWMAEQQERIGSQIAARKGDVDK